ncbi:hypothetical protein SMC26_39600 [Actinomadura fulvescens]|uniref:Uncharacterized protein n=1 Tax=Actinomadura fulvescens TaxID=46160 RepID=A0ABN3PZL3_9ACTN
MGRSSDLFMDRMSGAGRGESPCLNCESEPARGGHPFCSPGCRGEYEGWDFVYRIYDLAGFDGYAGTWADVKAHVRDRLKNSQVRGRWELIRDKAEFVSADTGRSVFVVTRSDVETDRETF